MKYKRKLCPFLLATRAGQKAMRTQTMKSKIPPSHQPVDEASTTRTPSFDPIGLCAVTVRPVDPFVYK